MPDYYTPFEPNKQFITMSGQFQENALRRAQQDKMAQDMAINAPRVPLAGQYAQAELMGTPFAQQQAANKFNLENQDLTMRRLAQDRANQQFQRQQQLAEETLRHNREAERRASAEESRKINAPHYDAASQSWVFPPGSNQAPNGTSATGSSSVKVQGLEPVKQMSVPQESALTSGAGILEKLVAMRNDFKPEYAGKILPGISTVQNAYSYLPNELPGVEEASKQRDWWRDYEGLVQATQRHSLYGAGLSGREISLSKSSAINPQLQPESVEKNMDARIGIMLTDLHRKTKSLSEVNNPKQIEAATGIPGIHKANLSPKSIDDYAEIGKTYRETGVIGQINKPKTREELDKLPSGSIYINPADGQPYTKK